jgi:hypothetical protein
MPKIIESGSRTLLPNPQKADVVSRRRFLGYAGAAAALAMAVASCDKDDNNPGPSTGIDLGSGDVGILNYAFALEQLEAAFYTQLILTPYAGIPADELSLITDIRDHEIAHREFFKNAIPAANRIQDLEVDFSSIDFNSRDKVLATARTFEDLGVSAYNGAGKLITNGAYLTIAGKIVSVEARHAAYIRDLISNGSFSASDVVDTNGLDKAAMPTDVLMAANGFLKTKVSGSNLPTS